MTGAVLKQFQAERAAGRMCPFDYRYDPSGFRRTPDLTADILYVAGGLYGNLAALDDIEAMAAAESAPVTLVFNGDFHWFDAEPDWFGEIERRVSGHFALRGNVETEIARDDDIGAGCGCAYPQSVGDDVVKHSNAILSDLRAIVARLPGAKARLPHLPMHRIAAVGPLRVCIVHGDAWSLAGWNFAHDALDSEAKRGRLASLRRETDIDIFASTHTCLAALRTFNGPDGELTVVNNGAAGMPNFTGSSFGLVTRIATTPSPHPALYGTTRHGVHIGALPVRYDQARFLSRFLARWSAGTAAHDSYIARITNGPDYTMRQAAPTATMAAL